METSFEDPDGNSLALVGYDAATREFEAQRRAAQELEIAKQVQARLFPQTVPPLPTLDYAGICLQARNVGGDYYDFLDLGLGRIGLVIADIAGKGIAAALLMANLQANLRSQCAIALAEPRRFLQSVNQLFYEILRTVLTPPSFLRNTTTTHGDYASQIAGIGLLFSSGTTTLLSGSTLHPPYSDCSRNGIAR